MNSATPILITEKIEGKKFFVTHGHAYNVKNPASSELKDTAMWFPCEANVILYGHTHKAHLEHEFCCEILNAGTIGFSTPTYGLIVIDNGHLSAEIKSVTNPQPRLSAEQVMI